MPEMQESDSSSDFGDGSERHQSHGGIARAADAVRVGLWRETHHQPDATAFHGLPAAANDSGEDEAPSPKTESGRAATGSTDALRVALPREAYRHDDAEALLSMPQTSNRFDVRSVPIVGASTLDWFAAANLRIQTDHVQTQGTGSAHRPRI